MADLLDLFAGAPAVWGLAGAWIYAAPRWLACVYGQPGTFWKAHWRCTLEAGVCLAVGALAAAAFAGWIITAWHPVGADMPAIAAMIGLLANPIAPRLVDGLSSAAAGAITARLTGKRLPPPTDPRSQPPRSTSDDGDPAP